MPNLISPSPWNWWDTTTPGQPRPEKYDLARLIAADGSRVWGCYGGAGDLALGKTPRDMANARLVMNAPELLKLADRFFSFYELHKSARGGQLGVEFEALRAKILGTPSA